MPRRKLRGGERTTRALALKGAGMGRWPRLQKGSHWNMRAATHTHIHTHTHTHTCTCQCLQCEDKTRRGRRPHRRGRGRGRPNRRARQLLSIAVTHAHVCEDATCANAPPSRRWSPEPPFLPRHLPPPPDCPGAVRSDCKMQPPSASPRPAPETTNHVNKGISDTICKQKITFCLSSFLVCTLFL